MGGMLDVVDSPQVPLRHAALRQRLDCRFAKGIKVEAPCLMCHGPKDSIAPDVAQAITAKYPADLATGFRLGDLRGLIWAEVSLGATGVDRP